MFAPVPAPAPKKASEPVFEKYAAALSDVLVNKYLRPAEPAKSEEPLSPLRKNPKSQLPHPAPIEIPAETTPIEEPTAFEEPDVNITPSKDDLTGSES